MILRDGDKPRGGGMRLSKIPKAGMHAALPSKRGRIQRCLQGEMIIHSGTLTGGGGKPHGCGTCLGSSASKHIYNRGLPLLGAGLICIARLVNVV